MGKSTDDQRIPENPPIRRDWANSSPRRQKQHTLIRACAAAKPVGGAPPSVVPGSEKSMPTEKAVLIRRSRSGTICRRRYPTEKYRPCMNNCSRQRSLLATLLPQCQVFAPPRIHFREAANPTRFFRPFMPQKDAAPPERRWVLLFPLDA